jgi:hypothetical protein
MILMFNTRFRIVVPTIAFLIVGMITTAAGQCVEAPEDLEHWWTADGHTFDIIGGEHGLLVGGTYGTGKVGQAFDLDGDGDQVVVPNNKDAPYNFTGAFTVDAWVFLDAIPTQFAPIVSKWNDIGTDSRGYFLAIEFFQGQPRLRFDVSRNGLFDGTNSAIRYASTIFPTGEWVHVAGVFDPTQTVQNRLRVYINGSDASGAFQVPAEVTSVFVNDEPLRIGAGDLGGDVRDFFNGRIDEVELFDRALTAMEVAAIFGAGSSGKTIPISLDIKPGSDENPINLRSQGTTPVAILGTETFDVTTVDVESIRFAGAPIRVKPNGTLHYSYEDVNEDGILDLMMHFSTQDLDLDQDSTEASITGVGGQNRCISGTDNVTIVPPRNLPTLRSRPPIEEIRSR